MKEGQSENHLRRSRIQGHKENRDQRAKRKIRTVVVIEKFLEVNSRTVFKRLKNCVYSNL